MHLMHCLSSIFSWIVQIEFGLKVKLLVVL